MASWKATALAAMACTRGPPWVHPGQVGHGHQEQGPRVVGDGPEAGKVNGPGVGAGPGDEYLGTVLLGQGGYLLVVQGLALPVDAVEDEVEEAAGEIDRGAVGQVAPVGQAHSHHPSPCATAGPGRGSV